MSDQPPAIPALTAWSAWLTLPAGHPLTTLDLALAGLLQASQPSADARHPLLAALTSHQFSRGHACLDLGQLQHSPTATLGWSVVDWEALLAAAAALPASADANPWLAGAQTLAWTQGAASPLVLDGPRLYLRRNWQAEQSIAHSIRARLAQPSPDSAGLREALAAWFPPVADAPPGPDWQKVACALAARSGLVLITGGPGTGKTTTVVRLLGLLQAQSAQPLRMMLAAPTGKAAARLGQSISLALQHLPEPVRKHIPTQAQTLHKLLRVRPPEQASAPPTLAADVVVVDEASMIDLALMARLMQAVPLGARLVLLGDKDQLASVEAGAVMGQLCQGAQAGGYHADTVAWLREVAGQDVGAWAGAGSSLAQHTVMLRHSRRFGAESAIGQWAQAVNAGQRALVQNLWGKVLLSPVNRSQSAIQIGAIVSLPSAGPPMAQPTLQGMAPASPFDAQWLDRVRGGWAAWQQGLQAVLALPGGCSSAQALQLLGLFAQFQVLCALRQGPWGVESLNRVLAQALGLPAQGWYAGRPVMLTRNDYTLGLMNGDVGQCLPTARGLRVAFADAHAPDGVRWVLPSRLDAPETVLAMTVHKSQGSEFDHVALVLPAQPTPVLTRELLYTGITRAKSQLTLVAPNPALLAEATAHKVWRSGGLALGVHGQGG